MSSYPNKICCPVENSRAIREGLRILDGIKSKKLDLSQIKSDRYLGDNGLGKGYSQTTILDCMRPPLICFPLVSHLLADQNRFGVNIFALEFGYAAAAKVLSHCMDLPTTFTYSLVYDPECIPATKPTENPEEPYLPDGLADIVILNLPTLKQICVSHKLRQMDYQVTRFQLRKARDWEPEDPTTHVQEYLDLAMERLKPGGILVLLGDCDIHHFALHQIEKTKKFQPRIVRGMDTVSGPVRVFYTEKTLARYWMPHPLPNPTDRYLSIWDQK